MMNLNTNQKKAVETIDKNVAVNAGAGSGKTKVLVERYLYILDKGKLRVGNEIESIVAITFTKKASQEMKERIREDLRGRFSEGKKWRRIYRDLEKANISTIHSFCSKILRENPIEANIDPQFNVMEDYEANNLLYEVTKKVLLEGIEKEEVYDFVKTFDAYNLDNLINTLMYLYEKIRCTGMSFEEVGEITINNIESIRFDSEDVVHIRDEFSYLISQGRKNSKISKLQYDPVWQDFSNRESFDEEVVDMLPYLKVNIGNMKKEAERIEALEELIDKVLLIKELQNISLYKVLIKLLIQMDEEYSNEKKAIGSLDYEDLQLKTLHLLEEEDIRTKYQKKFQYIMVDEFQDTNELQKHIIYKLTSVNSILDRQNLFIVGDPKQSIYAFRGADVDVFYDVMDDIEKVSNIKPITLEENYRSLNTVLEFINIIFEKLMGKKYDPLKPVNESPNNIDVEILEKSDVEVPDGVTEGEYNKYFESRLIAKRIKTLVEENGYQYGDFAILFRSTTDDNIYEEALREYSIPYYNLGGKGFFRQQEIVDLINAIKGINNIYDDISIVGILRSPMFGLSDEAIYWILRQKCDCILDTLSEPLKNINSEEDRKVKEAYNILYLLTLKRNLLNPYELLVELIDKTYYKEVLLLMYGGKQRVANVHKFLELTRDYTEEENGTLSDFIDYIEDLNRNEVEESQAKIESEDGDSVKLMTIHKSKGLQFKVVIIPQMSKRFNMDRSSILFDKNLGLGIKNEDSSPRYNEIKAVMSEKDEEENKRILYVAMTRAKEKLILGNQGSESGFKKFIGEFLESVQYDLIEDISMDSEVTEEVKELDSTLWGKLPLKNDDFPLLGSLPGYNQKSFTSYSVTQYLTFRECKRKFYMNYYKKLPSIEFEYEEEDFIEEVNNVKAALRPDIRGNIVHKFCELYTHDIDWNELLNDIIINYGLKPNEEVIKELKPYISNYMDKHIEDYDKMYNEKRFYYKLDNGIIYGIIDRIYIKDNSIELVDFKTNRINNLELLIEKYTPQLQLYASACSDILRKKVTKASLFFLENGELVDVDISESSLNNNIANLNSFMEYVTKNDDINAYKKCNNCNNYCPFKDICN